MKLSAQIKSINSYEQIQQTMALLKILALGMNQVEKCNVIPARDVIKRLRKNREVK